MKNKLTYNNDWEYDRYFIGKKELNTLTKVRIADKEYDVTPREVSVPYNDMGHNYEATSVHYFVKESVFGMEQTFDLNSLVSKIMVVAVEFTFKEEK